jgi:hypothetical protein
VTVDRLGPSASLMAALRAELGRKPERAGARDPTPARATQADPTRQPPRDPAVLRRELAALVRDVSPDDPQALDAVRPQVIRSVLLWEFGQELREYGEWQPMLDRLTQTLERNEKHRADFAQMVRDIQRSLNTSRSTR